MHIYFSNDLRHSKTKMLAICFVRVVPNMVLEEKYCATRKADRITHYMCIQKMRHLQRA